MARLTIDGQLLIGYLEVFIFMDKIQMLETRIFRDEGSTIDDTD
jgi:hypothetical protein